MLSYAVDAVLMNNYVYNMAGLQAHILDYNQTFGTGGTSVWYSTCS